MKTCARCKEEKDFSKFNKQTLAKDGHNSWCRKCSNKSSYEYVLDNPEQFMVNDARRRAKKKGLPFNITKEDINISSHCPVFGFKMSPNRCGVGSGRSSGGGTETSPSLDRIIPELGYVKGNVRVISFLANRIMSSATPEQIMIVAKYAAENG